MSGGDVTHFPNSRLARVSYRRSAALWGPFGEARAIPTFFLDTTRTFGGMHLNAAAKRKSVSAKRVGFLSFWPFRWSDVACQMSDSRLADLRRDTVEQSLDGLHEIAVLKRLPQVVLTIAIAGRCVLWEIVRTDNHAGHVRPY